MGYANPTAIIVVSIFFPAIGAVAVALRFYTRQHLRAPPSIDDWLIVPAWVLECVLAGLMIWGAMENSLGLRIPKPNVPGPMGYVFSDSPQQVRFLMIQYLMDLLGVWEFGFIKLSILFFYRKIFCSAGVGRTTFDLITRFMIALIGVWTVAFGIGFVFICQTDFSAAWGTLANLEEHCPAQLPFLQGFAISDFITDCLIMILPIPTIWGLHLPIRQRLAIIGVFLVGILTLAASCTRMTIWNMYIVNAFSQPDGETLVTVLLFWSMIESGLGVLVACLPTLRPLYTHFVPSGIFSGLRSYFTLRSSSSKISSTPIRHHYYAESHGSTYSTEQKVEMYHPAPYGMHAYASRAA